MARVCVVFPSTHGRYIRHAWMNYVHLRLCSVLCHGQFVSLKLGLIDDCYLGHIRSADMQLARLSVALICDAQVM